MTTHCREYLQINYKNNPSIKLDLKIENRPVDTTNLIVQGILSDVLGNAIVILTPALVGHDLVYQFTKIVNDQIKTYFDNSRFTRHTALLQTKISSTDQTQSYYDHSIDCYLEFIK